MLESAGGFGREFTPHVKIKLDADVGKAKRVLDALNLWCSDVETKEGIPEKDRARFSVDANCAWTPEIAMEMLEHVLLPHKRRIFMVEQPFPVELTVYRTDEEGSEAIQAWTRGARRLPVARPSHFRG